MMSLTSFVRVFPSGPEEPLQKHFLLHAMQEEYLDEISRSLRVETTLQRDCHLRTDQRFGEGPCPGKVQLRDTGVI